MKGILHKSKTIIKSALGQQTNQNEQLPLILNEAINFDLQTIFIAVPKTGTTSVRTQIRPQGKVLIPSAHLSILQIRDTLYTYLLRMSLGKNTSYPTTDILTDAEVRSQCSQIFTTFFKFSAVRNPWARAVSLYFIKEGVKVHKNTSFVC